VQKAPDVNSFNLVPGIKVIFCTVRD